MLYTPLLQGEAEGGLIATLAASGHPGTANITALEGDSGAIAATQQPNTASITANVVTSSTSGTLAATQQPNAAAFSVSVAITGALAATAAHDVAAITAIEGDAGILAATQRANVAGWGGTVWAPTGAPSGIVLHFDASTIPAQADGTVLPSWTDAVGGYVAAQGTTARQPKYHPSSRGGMPSVEFEGLQNLTFDGTLGSNVKNLVDSGNYTLLIALSDVGVSSIGTVFGSSTGSTAFAFIANGAYIGRYDGNVTGHTLPWTAPDFVVMGATSETTTAGNYGGMGIAFEREYLDGTIYKSENAAIPATSASLFAIGDNSGGNAATGKFKVYDIVLIDHRLTPAEMLAATVWLRQQKNQPLPWGGLARFDVQDGDSIRDNVGVTPGTGAAYLAEVTRGRKPGQWTNFAIGSIRAQQSTAKLSEIADYMAYLGLPANVLYFEYINGQNANRTSAQLVQDIVDYVSTARSLMPSARFEIQDSTAYGRDLTDRLYASYRGVFNSGLAAVASKFDHYTAISADPDIGDPSANNRVPPTVGADTVHLNALGHNPYLAGYTVSGLNALDAATASFGFLAATGRAGTMSATATDSVSGTLGGVQQKNVASITANVVDPGVVAGTLAAAQQPNVAALTAASTVAATIGAVAAPGTAQLTAQVNASGTLGASGLAGIANLTAVVHDPESSIGVLAAVQRPNVASFLGASTGLSVPQAIFGALRSLVADRVYPNEFPQGNPLPVWPAIRYTIISGDPSPTVCGSGDEDEDDVTVFIDVVATTYPAMRALKKQVITALQSTDPPCSRQPGGQEGPDGETKTQRVVMTYHFQQSSNA